MIAAAPQMAQAQPTPTKAVFSEHPTNLRQKREQVLQRNAAYATPGPWTTKLKPKEEAQFQQWAQANKGTLSMEDMAENPGYDMRGFWKAKMAGDPRAQNEVNAIDHLKHYPDVWKTPYHDSFNKQSMYSTPDNPNHWVGDSQDPALVGANNQVIIPRRSGKPTDWNYKQ